MSTYSISLESSLDGIDTLKLGFGEPGQNDQIVQDVLQDLEELELGGTLVKLSGPASLPVMVALAAYLANAYNAIAVWDPKISKYVVSYSISHTCEVGDLID